MATRMMLVIILIFYMLFVGVFLTYAGATYGISSNTEGTGQDCSMTYNGSTYIETCVTNSEIPFIGAITNVPINFITGISILPPLVSFFLLGLPFLILLGILATFLPTLNAGG